MDWARVRRILLTVGFAAAAILWLSERARPQETAAPQTPATLSTYINAYIPDNTSGFVTPAYLRAVLHSMNASYINSVSTTGVFGPGSSTAGHLATWNNTGGSLLADSPISATVLSAVANPANSANGLPVLNGSGFLATAQGGLGLAPNASAASAMANAPCATNGFMTQPGTWVSGDAVKIGVSGCMTDAGSAPMTLGGTSQSFTGGVTVTPYSLGTISSGSVTPNCGNGPIQTLNNAGAFTLNNLSADGSCLLQMNGTPTTGAVSLGGFVSSPTGNGDGFITGNTTFGTVTFTGGSPCTVNYTTWGYYFGYTVSLYFTTTGSLPTGLSTNTIYYVSANNASTFTLSATPGGAQINCTGNGTPTTTVYVPPILSVFLWRLNGASYYYVKQVQ